MSGRRLVAYVFVRDEHGRSVRFGPRDDVPGWAAEKIRNPRAWAADEDPDEQDDNELQDILTAGDEQGQAPGGSPGDSAPVEGQGQGQAPAPTPDAVEQTGPANTAAPVQPGEVHEQPNPPAAPAAVEPPPRSGRGSGAPVWAKYASDHGVEVGEDDSRDDIIAALEAAGIRTD